ncbi:nicotinamide mononucleotide transporter PnuC family domain protein [Francisella tularensis subsp. holarctica]|nr:nicotinamide mononucleotide transporter [Francisella tularensis subsp. holarctica F92]AJI67840.1 nicotinamide mononucleotide transporter PnuC family domain protein [Francisella tularensis subsp. holarctica]
MNIQVINDFFSRLANYFRGFKNIKLSNIFNDWNIFEILWLVISVTSLGIISI